MNVVFFNVLLAASLAFVFWRGGRPERLVAATFLAGALLTRVAVVSAPARFVHIDPAGLTIDLAIMGVLLAIAMRANGYWPLAVAALHLASVLAYLARAIAPDMLPEVLRILQSFLAYPQLLVLVAGALRHRRRLEVAGVDRPWS